MIHAVAAVICAVIAAVIAIALSLATGIRLEFNLTTLTVTVTVGNGLVVTASYRISKKLIGHWISTGNWPGWIEDLDRFLRSRTARSSRLFAIIAALCLVPTTWLLWRAEVVQLMKLPWPMLTAAAVLWVIALLSPPPSEPQGDADQAPAERPQPSAPPDLVAWWERMREHDQFRGQIFLEERRPARTIAPLPGQGIGAAGEAFRLVCASPPRAHQIEAMRALSGAGGSAALLYHGSTGAGKTTAVLAIAIGRIIDSAETILLIADDRASALRLASLIRDAYVADLFRSALSIHTIEEVLAPAAPGADILVGTWETLHQALLATRSAELWEFFLNLGLVWIEDGGKLSGPRAGHAAGLLRRLDVLLAGQPPDVVLVTSSSVPDEISFMRSLTGRRDVASVPAASEAPRHLLAAWQPAVAVIDTDNGTRRFHLRQIRNELRDLCAILSEQFPGNVATLRVLVYHCDVSLSIQDRQAAVATVRGTFIFAADLGELEAEALRNRFHAAIILGSPSRDAGAVEHIIGFVHEDAPVILIPSPGVLAAAWLRLPSFMPQLCRSERVVPLELALPLHHAYAKSDEGLADEADRRGIFGVAERAPLANLFSLDDLPEGPDDRALPIVRTPGDEPLQISVMLSRLIDRAAPGLFIEQPELVRREPMASERRRYRVVGTSTIRIAAEGPHDFSVLRGSSFDSAPSSITRVTAHLTAFPATVPMVNEKRFAWLRGVRVAIVRDGLLAFDGREDPEVGVLRELPSESVERVLGGWAVHLPGEASITALWDVADLLSAVMSLVIVPGEAATPLTAVDPSGIVSLFDRAGDGATFSALNPDDDRKLGAACLLLSYVSLLACPCGSGCSRCLGVFDTCRPSDQLGRHDKHAAMTLIGPLVEPLLDSDAELRDRLNALRDPVNLIHDDTERYRFIRDTIALPIMKRAVDIELRDPADLTAHVQLGENDSVIGQYLLDTNEVRIRTGLGPGQSEATVTHEYTHNWQHESNFPVDELSSLDDAGRTLLREGFAEWVSYKILQARGRIEEMNSIELRHGDEYGSGFEFFRHLEEEQGQRGVMQFARDPSTMKPDELHRRIRLAWMKGMRGRQPREAAS